MYTKQQYLLGSVGDILINFAVILFVILAVMSLTLNIYVSFCPCLHLFLSMLYLLDQIILFLARILSFL